MLTALDFLFDRFYRLQGKGAALFQRPISRFPKVPRHLDQQPNQNDQGQSQIKNHRARSKMNPRGDFVVEDRQYKQAVQQQQALRAPPESFVKTRQFLRAFFFPAEKGHFL